MTPHHFTLFYWSKQITGPAQIQAEGRETPQLTGRSDNSCQKRTSSACIFKIYLMIWRIFHKLLLAPFIFNLAFTPPPLKHLVLGAIQLAPISVPLPCSFLRTVWGEKCSWVVPPLGESEITEVAGKSHEYTYTTKLKLNAFPV